MSSPLSAAITDLSSGDAILRAAAATEIYRRGRAPADRAVHDWWKNSEFTELFDANSVVTVGLAVRPSTFASIRKANGSPPLAKVPPDQDAEEFELNFPGDIFLDVLTTRDLEGQGAIAKYLAKSGEGIQQVEFRCANVDRAAQILKEKFGISPIYPQTRPGADNTRVNFFLVPLPQAGKVLVELYERGDGD
jgi:methylmalonyl-CoA/ethylmalonyl-CoA epimerase